MYSQGPNEDKNTFYRAFRGSTRKTRGDATLPPTLPRLLPSLVKGAY